MNIQTGNTKNRPRSPGPSPKITFLFENDVFVNTDRQYTHGWNLIWTSRNYGRNNPKPKWSRPFFGMLLLLDRSGSLHNLSFTLRQDIYTPGNLRRSKLIPDDRPYAGVLLVSAGFHLKNERILTSLNCDVGIVGPGSQAQVTQNNIHDLIDAPHAGGWHHQLKDEPIVNLHILRRWEAWQWGSTPNSGIQIYPRIGGGLGNMKTYACAGFELRFGKNMPRTYGSSTLNRDHAVEMPNEKLLGDSPHPVGGVYTFISMECRAVLRDIFLDGNTFKDSHSVDKRIFIGHMACGFGFYAGRLHFVHTIVFQTKQFDTQNRAHVFGGIAISVRI
jgi:hypothetical protein